jgi:hypothetical protein
MHPLFDPSITGRVGGYFVLDINSQFVVVTEVAGAKCLGASSAPTFSSIGTPPNRALLNIRADLCLIGGKF